MFPGDLSLGMAARARAELWRDRNWLPPRLCVEISGVEEAWSRQSVGSEPTLGQP